MLWKLFLAFFKVGVFGFGGGNAMLALIEREVVAGYHLVTKEEFTEIVAVNFAVPGVTALKVAFGVGLRTEGMLGAFISMIGVALPSVVFSMIAFSLLFKYKDNPVIKKIFDGVAYAIIGLLIAVAFNLFPSFQQTPAKTTAIGIFLIIITVVAIVKFKLHPIWLIIASGILSLCLF